MNKKTRFFGRRLGKAFYFQEFLDFLNKKFLEELGRI
jgi:hypothetical protein